MLLSAVEAPVAMDCGLVVSLFRIFKQFIQQTPGRTATTRFSLSNEMVMDFDLICYSLPSLIFSSNLRDSRCSQLGTHGKSSLYIGREHVLNKIDKIESYSLRTVSSFSLCPHNRWNFASSSANSCLSLVSRVKFIQSPRDVRYLRWKIDFCQIDKGES